MQMFGVGLPELLVILFVAALVIGPDKVPQVAADLARWIRRARAYGEHLSRDFTDVIGDLEREVGTSRDDWKEIANVFRLPALGVGNELTSVASSVRQSLDLSQAKEGQPALIVPSDAVASTSEPSAEVITEEAPVPLRPVEEKPWYVPDAGLRRRAGD